MARLQIHLQGLVRCAAMRCFLQVKQNSIRFQARLFLAYQKSQLNMNQQILSIVLLLYR